MRKLTLILLAITLLAGVMPAQINNSHWSWANAYNGWALEGQNGTNVFTFNYAPA